MTRISAEAPTRSVEQLPITQLRPALSPESSRLDPENGSAERAYREPSFLSVAETAKNLSVSDDAVYDLLHRGVLPCLRIGRRRVIPRRAIELMIDHLLTGFDPAQLAAWLTSREHDRS